MMQHSLIITLSWLGSVSLQYINTGGPGANVGFDPLDTAQYPLPYMGYSAPSRSDFETLQNDPLNEQFYQRDDVLTELQRKRRTSEKVDDAKERDRRWAPNLVDTDKTVYLQNEDGNPYMIGYSSTVDENATANDILDPMDKKYFSPWGGKRDKHSTEHMWTWKRANNIREPSMPKRVRFSPWGGKRSGQMIYKPGSKSSRIIFSTSIPELTRIVSNYSPNEKRLDFAGFQFVPIFDKRHPIKILALTSNMNEKTIREAMPFKSFLETLPKLFKPGHPYLDVNLKKDGKRKVKFSAWGGKRSPPIIGPIWTPASQDVKDSTLETILLIRNGQEPHKDEPVTRAS